jgi:acyl-CoA hydrolase
LSLDKFSSKFIAVQRFRRTACGEPQYLVRSLADFVRSHPKSVFGAEVFQVWSLGVAPYAEQGLKRISVTTVFFIGKPYRKAINGVWRITLRCFSPIPEHFTARPGGSERRLDPGFRRRINTTHEFWASAWM